MLEGDEEGCAETLGDADGELEGPADGPDEGPEEGALLKLGLLEGDEEGCAETLGDPDGEVDGPVDGSDEGPEEGALLKLGSKATKTTQREQARRVEYEIHHDWISQVACSTCMMQQDPRRFQTDVPGIGLKTIVQNVGLSHQSLSHHSNLAESSLWDLYR